MLSISTGFVPVYSTDITELLPICWYDEKNSMNEFAPEFSSNAFTISTDLSITIFDSFASTKNPSSNGTNTSFTSDTIIICGWARFACEDKTQHSTVQYSTVQYSTVQYSTVQYSTVQYSTVQYSTVQYSTVQYSTVQYSTVQYSTVQYSTVQYSTVQYNTAQYGTYS